MKPRLCSIPNDIRNGSIRLILELIASFHWHEFYSNQEFSHVYLLPKDDFGLHYGRIRTSVYMYAYIELKYQYFYRYPMRLARRRNFYHRNRERNTPLIWRDVMPVPNIGCMRSARIFKLEEEFGRWQDLIGRDF